MLLGEPLPRQLARAVPDHGVTTVPRLDWTGLRTGLLLGRMVEDGIDVLVTADHNVEHQQNLARFAVGLVVFVSLSNSPDDLVPLGSRIAEAVSMVQPGLAVHVAANPPPRR